MAQHVVTEVSSEGVGVLTLNRPEKKNALSIALREEICECLQGWTADEKVRAVVITGAGAAFSAGFDLGEFGQPELMRTIFESSARYHRLVWTFAKPTIAAVNGAAYGGGFDLATLCDLRLASTAATFRHPEIKFGAPPLFTPLRWLVGDGRAREYCLTGRVISAEEALRVGLVNELTEPGALLSRAIAVAQSIIEAPAATLLTTKKYMIEAGGRDFEASFRAEHDDVFLSFLEGGGPR